MANASISGLVSGLDTASIIDQLMQIEAQPQNRLKTQLTTQQSTLTTLQSLNAKIAALATTAKDASTPTSWAPVVASSSDTSVTVSAAAGATGSFDVTVNQVATASRLSFDATHLPTDVVVTNGTTVKLTVGSTTYDLDSGDGTLAGLAAAVNRSGSGVKASTIKLDDGSSRLMLQSVATGAASSFSLTDSQGNALDTAATVAGKNATVTIGNDTISSATNTFSGVVTGVTFNISSASVGKTVSLTVGADPSAAKAKAKALVDGVNTLLTQLDGLTSYDPATKSAGALAGDSIGQSLRSALFNSVFPADGSTMKDVGIQTDRNGMLVFDGAAFDKAYAADPDKVTTAFTGGTTGFADRLAAAAAGASDPRSGTLTSAITGRNTSISRIQDDISQWDTRLELKRTTLNRQFTALETALNQMQSQSSWLAGQISGLSSSSG